LRAATRVGSATESRKDAAPGKKPDPPTHELERLRQENYVLQEEVSKKPGPPTRKLERLRQEN